MAKFNRDNMEAAASRKNTKTTKTAQSGPVNDHVFEVQNVREWDDGGISFSLVVDKDTVIYDCKLATGSDGKPFVSFPARKGKDGKYYKRAFVRMTREQDAAIVQDVLAELPEE